MCLMVNTKLSSDLRVEGRAEVAALSLFERMAWKIFRAKSKEVTMATTMTVVTINEDNRIFFDRFRVYDRSQSKCMFGFVPCQ